MTIDASIISAQSGLIINNPPRDTQRNAEARQQQSQQQPNQLPRAQIVVRQGGAEAAERFQEQDQRTFRESPSQRGRDAVNAYLSLERENRRGDIQQLLGVDTYV